MVFNLYYDLQKGLQFILWVWFLFCFTAKNIELHLFQATVATAIYGHCLHQQCWCLSAIATTEAYKSHAQPVHWLRPYPIWRLQLRLQLLLSVLLKPLDTFGKQNCPKAHTSCITTYIYKITNQWKFRLNRSSESGENNGKTHPCFCTFRHVMMCLDIGNLYCLMFSQKVKHFME